MSALDKELQAFFLWDYARLPREKMLVDFIECHAYSLQTDRDPYRVPSDPYQPEFLEAMSNGGPGIPAFLTEACAELAKLRGFTPMELIKSVLVNPEQAVVQSDNYNPPNNYQALLKEYTDLFNGTRLGKWLN